MFIYLSTQNGTSIENASIPEQINVSQIIEDITSEPENLTDIHVSISANIISQLTTGATMDAEVSIYESIMLNYILLLFIAERQLSTNY